MGKKITFKGETKDLPHWKGQPWDKPLTPEMKAFEKKTGKHAVYRGVVTGTFEYITYWKEYDDSLKQPRGFQSGHKYYGKAGAKKASATKKKTGGASKPGGTKGSKKGRDSKDQLSQEEIIKMYMKHYKVDNVNVKSKKFQAFATKMLEKYTT